MQAVDSVPLSNHNFVSEEGNVRKTRQQNSQEEIEALPDSASEVNSIIQIIMDYLAEKFLAPSKIIQYHLQTALTVQKARKISRVVFLDIEGVLFPNNLNISEKVKGLCPSWDKNSDYYLGITATYFFKFEAVSHLEKFIKKLPNIGIVISSHWRYKYSLPQLKEILSRYNFSKFIIDQTPMWDDEEYCDFSQESNSRAKEITYWLTKHPEIKNFVILNGEGLFAREFFNKLVKPSYMVLLSGENIRAVQKILAAKSE